MLLHKKDKIQADRLNNFEIIELILNLNDKEGIKYFFTKKIKNNN